jgi:heme/copper-type cytochrome/quinol oxidase subunit 2
MNGSEMTRPAFYKTTAPWSSWLLLVFCFIGVFITIVLSYFSYSWEVASHGTARSLNSIIPFLCLISVFAIIFLIILIRLIISKPMEITFTADSLQINHKGKQWQIVYAEIQSIYRRDELNLFLLFPIWKKEMEIHTPQGIAKIQGNIRHFDQMVRELESRVYPGIYLHDQEMLAGGKIVKFGEILLNQQGLKIRENIILWSQAAGTAIERGTIVIKYWQDGKIQDLKVSAGSTPNIPVFLKLAEEHIHTAGRL